MVTADPLLADKQSRGTLYTTSRVVPAGEEVMGEAEYAFIS
jgi:hypothetical protein